MTIEDSGPEPEKDVIPFEDAYSNSNQPLPIDAIGQVETIELSELEDELNAWLKTLIGNRQAQI